MGSCHPIEIKTYPAQLKAMKIYLKGIPIYILVKTIRIQPFVHSVALKYQTL